MDDTELLRRYVEEGSEAAFSELVGRYLNLVHSIALRQVGGDFHRARDVTQIVFALLARRASWLVRHPALTGWLYNSTYFSARTLMRNEGIRQTRQQEALTMNEILASPERTVAWDQLRPLLDGMMLELNERDREAVVWRFFDGQSLAVIGEKLGITENTAGMRVNRALEKLRRSFTRRGMESTTGALALMLANHAVGAAPAGLAENVTASALASAAGSPAPLLLRLLVKAKLAIGVAGLAWLGGILGIFAIGGSTYALWAAAHAKAALAWENKGYAAQQQQFSALRRIASRTRRPATPVAKSAAMTWDPKADFKRFVATYPAARPLLLGQEELMVTRAYGSFFKSAGLGLSQIERFEEAVAESRLQPMMLTPDAFVLGGSPMPAEGRIRAILGDQAYQQFLDYGQNVNAHYWAATIAALSPGVSFSSEQLDRLAQILANNDAAPPPRYSIRDSRSLASLDWEAVLTQAKALLSASQWAVTAPILFQLQAKNLPAEIRSSPASPESPSP